MKRRSEKLDQFLNKQVKITFIDGDSIIGVFGWNEHLEPLMISPQYYYLRTPSGVYYTFRKSHVKQIREYKEQSYGREYTSKN